MFARSPSFRLLLPFFIAVASPLGLGCGAESGDEATPSSATGGDASTGGTAFSAGGDPSTGGTVSSTGGSLPTGGTVSATGGYPSTGGTVSSTGGSLPTGGTVSTTGGYPSTGGTVSGTGGDPSTGGGGSTGGSVRIEAESFDAMAGIENKGTVVGSCDDGEWLRYDGIDFGTGYATLAIQVAVGAGHEGQIVHFRLDATDGTEIGTLVVRPTGDWTVFDEQSIALYGAAGLHDLYVVFEAVTPLTTGVGDFDWFELRDPGSTGTGGTGGVGGSGGSPATGGTPATGGSGGGPACAQATGTYYHVSGSGNDTSGDGSSGSPWRTITHALGQVPADQGHAILLSAGTFDEADTLTIPSGVSLIGAGSDATTVRVNHRFDFTLYGTTCDGAADTSYDNYSQHFVVQMDGGNQCVSGFFLQGIQEGGSRKNHGGIFANWASNVVFSDLRIEDFVFAGLWVNTSEDTEVHHCTLRNNAWYNNATDTGNLLFHANAGLRIHHNLIEETDPVRGPYGIKSYAARWSNFCWWQWWAQNWADYADGMEITDNTILVPEMAGWTTGGNNVPGIAIEFNGISMRNVLIARNHLNNVVSLVGSYNNDGYAFWSARVMNNWFDLGRQYRYAVEANVPGLEFAYNFVDGGLYPLAQWESRRGNFQNQSIHHNVFNAPQGGQVVFQYSQGISDFQFQYNTVVDTEGVSALFGGATQSGTVLGNVLVAPSSRGGIIGSFTGTIDHNLFFNIATDGTAAVTGDPLLNASGSQPYPWFGLGAGSPAIDAGVVVAGITDDAVGAPDLGAFETGATPWSVGPAP